MKPRALAPLGLLLLWSAALAAAPAPQPWKPSKPLPEPPPKQEELLYKGKPCEHCHVEHIGRATKLIRWPDGAMDKLNHTLTGWPLEGGHSPVACLECHTRTSPLGKPQFVGVANTCGGCHKDPHTGRFGKDCQKCHGVTRWEDFDRKAFDHQLAKFPLTGKHTTVECEKCHAGTPAKWKPVEFSTCETCHPDPHKGDFKPKACTACHDTSAWNTAMDKMRKNHPKVSLAHGHARVACAACHDKGNHVPPSRGSKCESCHRPVHLARFGDRCETCHASIKWTGLPEAVGRDHHGHTRYPLEGKHLGVSCAQCHPSTVTASRRFKNLNFGTCLSCHADPHAQEFAARDQGECAQCHSVRGFLPTTFGVAAHATTRFALDGKHLAAPCGACHPGARPRTSFQLATQACADCHPNPHGAQFAAELAQGGCGRCHSTADWHQAKIDHSVWPLEGAHATAACAGCHGAQKGTQAAAYRGIPRECEGCHDDVHAGQFRQSSPVKACKDCHLVSTFQLAASFDHDRTRYPLRGKHRPLACAACHPSQRLRNGTVAVRYRLGYVSCKDCHANPHREAP
jgi:hypothetical protein